MLNFLVLARSAFSWLYLRSLNLFTNAEEPGVSSSPALEYKGPSGTKGNKSSGMIRIDRNRGVFNCWWWWRSYIIRLFVTWCLPPSFIVSLSKLNGFLQESWSTRYNEVFFCEYIGLCLSGTKGNKSSGIPGIFALTMGGGVDFSFSGGEIKWTGVR